MVSDNYCNGLYATVRKRDFLRHLASDLREKLRGKHSFFKQKWQCKKKLLNDPILYGLISIFMTSWSLSCHGKVFSFIERLFRWITLVVWCYRKDFICFPFLKIKNQVVCSTINIDMISQICIIILTFLIRILGILFWRVTLTWLLENFYITLYSAFIYLYDNMKNVFYRFRYRKSTFICKIFQQYPSFKINVSSLSNISRELASQLLTLLSYLRFDIQNKCTHWASFIHYWT